MSANQRKEYFAQRDRSRRALRRAQHRCVTCGGKLAPDDERKNCQPCRTRHATYNWRWMVRQDDARAARKPEPDEVEPTPTDLQRCPRCHLVLPHDKCLPTSAVHWAERRRSFE
jgi:RNA polymerase subunit RPABC4/transcription elongation factor Spt4